MKAKEELTRFAARDRAGRTFNIIAYQNYVIHKPVYGSQVTLKADMEYWTDNGLPVMKLDSETFRIATNKETITRYY